MSRNRTLTLLAGALALALTAGACSSGSDKGGSGAAVPAASGSQSLKGVCPDPVVVQTDWWPESEHGAVYQLLGPGYKADTGKKRITGPLVTQGKDTGVRIELRAGGPAIGFQQVSAQMYLDRSITLGFVATDSAAALSTKQSTLSVVSPLDLNPQMIMWDPQVHPEFHTIAGSYDGAPDHFVSSGGKIAQQGFATSEPYVYQNELPQWRKPVAFQLVNDTGYPTYSSALSIRSDAKSQLTSCLQRLVPMVQRAQIDFVKNPDPVNKLIVQVDKDYKSGYPYDAGLAKFTVEQSLKLGIVGNGTDKTLGNFDMSRIKRTIDIVTPIFAAQKQPVKAGLRPEDIATNEFIDPSIGLTL